MAEEKPSLTAAYVAEALGAALEGDGTVQLEEFSGIRGARAGSLSFVSDKRSSKIAAKSPAAALIAPEGFELKTTPKAVIRVKDLAAACDKAATLFSKPAPVYTPGIHPTAVIGKGVTLGKDVVIGPCVVVEEGSSVGDGTKLGAHVHLEPGVQVGKNCDIQGGVKVRYNCVIGDRVSLLPGVVIGGDGFGYTFKDGVHQKVPQIGNVIIEDDVEIGSNTTVDRARFGSTRIGRGTKIDNLVMIAHNVQIGSHCILTAQVGIAGSTSIGDYVIIGAQTGIVGHITIGSNTMIGAGSGVTKDIPPNSTIMGIPADNRPQAVRALMAVKRLPEMLIEMRGLKKIIKEHLRGDSETTTNN